ncbi:MAG TPA: ABC transporter substrate-binding protein, partial [Patescibacteria group bacterium]|nr:ABC transporter substrate-binding protein [Patescibacteria group bacterium]
TVSRPIFPKGLEGLGDYIISDLKINGEFISSLTLSALKNKRDQISYIFYPNQEALKTSFLLGQTSQIVGVIDPKILQIDLANSSNVQADKNTDYSQLVTLFFNTKDQVLSDNKLRKGLSYALPDSFTQGERAYLPYAPTSIYYNKDAISHTQDLAHAKLLIDASYSSASVSASQVLTLKTLEKYQTVAQQLAKVWRSLGVKTKIVVVDSRPDSFQMYLGDFTVPEDPDQYMLWHSDQESNITKFVSLRIDKLLEDGRKTADIAVRKKIYADFQKYLLDDAVIDTPASFLYFPYTYTITRH